LLDEASINVAGRRAVTTTETQMTMNKTVR